MWVVAGFVITCGLAVVAAVTGVMQGIYYRSPVDLIGAILVVPAGGVLLWWALKPDESIPSTLDEQMAKLRGNLESSSDLIREINIEFEL